MIIKPKKPPSANHKSVKRVRAVIDKVCRKPNERITALVSKKGTEVVSMWDDNAGYVSLRSKSGLLYMRHDREWVVPEGVLAGKYSVHIWPVVAALKIHKFITAKEAFDFLDWLREESRQYERLERERRLRQDAVRLGFDLVPLNPIVETKDTED